jgi:hypothetical protein
MLLELKPSVDLEAYLGPAYVVQTAGNRVHLDLPDDRRWATLALAFPYEPVPGDLVLAIGRGEALYVIGVLRGEGLTSFTAPADLRIRAPHGGIELTAAHGVRIKAPTIKLAAEKLELLATMLFERVAEATRWVENVLHLRAGEVWTRVKGDYDLKAGSVSARASEDVHIDGRKIYLG